jgi:transcriptional regulator with XRE-family HTH domain
MKNIAALFLETRTEHGLTAAQVSMVCGVTRAQISGIETSKSLPSFQTLGRFLRFFRRIDKEFLFQCLEGEAGCTTDPQSGGLE